MRVVIETDLVRVELNDRANYSPDVLEDMINRATQTAMHLTQTLSAELFGDDDGN